MTPKDEREAKVRAWLTGRLPSDWFVGPVEVTVDREEITVVGDLPTPDVPTDVPDAELAAAITGRVKQFREDTRDKRIEIARELEYRSDRKVAWGVDCGGERHMFTRLAAPVMTRLRQPERQVLDTLVDAGVARSRSEALARCVRLVGQHTEEWLAQLREATAKVEQVRASGPTAR